jgi:hypothetical protein
VDFTNAPGDYTEVQENHLCAKHAINHVLQEEKIVWLPIKAELVKKASSVGNISYTDKNTQINLSAYCLGYPAKIARERGYNQRYIGNEDMCDMKNGETPFELVFNLLNDLKYDVKKIHLPSSDPIKLPHHVIRNADVKTLTEMGYSINAAKRALWFLPAPSSNAQHAVDWFTYDERKPTDLTDPFDVEKATKEEADKLGRARLEARQIAKDSLYEKLADEKLLGVIINLGGWHFTAISRFVKQCKSWERNIEVKRLTSVSYAYMESLNPKKSPSMPIIKCIKRAELVDFVFELDPAAFIFVYAQPGAYKSVAMLRLGQLLTLKRDQGYALQGGRSTKRNRRRARRSTRRN